MCEEEREAKEWEERKWDQIKGVRVKRKENSKETTGRDYEKAVCEKRKRNGKGTGEKENGIKLRVFVYKEIGTGKGMRGREMGPNKGCLC